MEVLRVEIAAPVTSFRYPYFLIGKQVTYDMPPPSTIYGHIASALGELPGPASFQFGYHFRYAARGVDYEHQHIITAGGAAFEHENVKYRTSTQATVQPHSREFLFQPVLTLYLNRLDWLDAFRAPAFCVVLGRSQDLATITRCDQVILERRDNAYFENTLLPFTLRPLIGIGTTVTMSRFIAPPPRRQTRFAQYIMLRERAYAGDGDGKLNPIQRFQEPPADAYWVDPSIPPDRGYGRGVWFHSFID